MSKKNKIINANEKVFSKEQKITFFTNKPITLITLKSLIVIFFIASAILYSDSKGYFNPDQTNNHTKKKWDAFYDFTKKNNVDVLLLGNSHLYTGINPKNLSATLGVNAFILASPGTNISDTYFGLKEALKTTKPKLIVIETYGINKFNPYELKEGGLSDQFKSFYARKDFTTKLNSTPFLFKSDNYFYAWSNTLRNHDFFFNDTVQLAKNKVLISKKPKKNKKLYLGRYVRFQKGIDNKLLNKYDSLGSPVKGSEYTINNYTENYVEKIVNLCKKENVELIFLTLPMYYKHINNYSVWNKKISTILNLHPNKWINMQYPYDTTNFSTICFENTYKTNQHMTYNGSLIATYKLADYIKSEVNVKLPNRKNESKWINTFYGQEGYFENNPVLENDNINKLLAKNFASNNVIIEEISIIKPEKGDGKIIIAKIDNKNRDISKCKLRIAVSYVNNNTLQIANIDLQYDILHKIKDKYIFKIMIKPLDIRDIKAALLVCE